MTRPAPPPSRDFGKPANLPEQMAAARVLLDASREGLKAVPGWREDDPRQQDLDVAVAALRRVIVAALEDCTATRPDVLGAALAAALGDHVGQLLKGLPDRVVQEALMGHSQRLLIAIGADPTRSGADITISSGQETLN